MFVVNADTGENLRAGVIECASQEVLQFDASRFEFDWISESSFTVFRLEVLSSGEILGLMAIELIDEELRLEIRLLELSKDNIGSGRRFVNIAGILIAFACRLSFKMGFFGFVSLIPKTRLIEHYQTKYGFEQYGRHLAVDMERSQLLIKRYLENEE